tara:strand:+ start:325 stop:591 length:267 start_codon:yes stop_codon:yes gene_type:complete
MAKTKTTLVNFNIPSYLHKEFKTICSMNHHTMTTAFIEMIQEYVDKESKTIEERKNRVADLSDYERVKKVNELDEIARRLTEIENKLK